MGVNSVDNPMNRVFALAADCDATQLKLTAAEGYLLSRVDGTTPLRLLREIGGIPAADVETCVERWLEEGVLEVVGPKAKGLASQARPSATSQTTPETSSQPTSSSTAAASMDAGEADGQPFLPSIDEGKLNESLDIQIDIQRRILEFEAGLGRPYHTLLNVEVGAPPKAVKRAYFKLSKEFHPDRFFRKDIGEYAERLDRIFKKVLEAHEMLSDPELCGVENQSGGAEEFIEAVPPEAASTSSGPTPSTASPTAGTSAEKQASAQAGNAKAQSTPQSAKKRPLTKLERLRQRMPFKINHAALAERRARAQEIFKAAELSQRNGRLQEAEANIRIAISFDPGRAEFKEALGSLRIEAAGARAAKLMAASSDRMSDSELREILTLLEDVLPYRPHDPDLNERAARVCLKLGKLDDAAEYVETLIARTPETAMYHSMLGKVERERGNNDEAMRAFETALKYDEEDVDARRAIASMRIGARDAARGGRS
ncbi:MAG: tetratricopeptide repeat protein [Myxococcota bacterium]